MDGRTKTPWLVVRAYLPQRYGKNVFFLLFSSSGGWGETEL